MCGVKNIPVSGMLENIRPKHVEGVFKVKQDEGSTDPLGSDT
jgi:hypothetical protein